MKKWIMQIVTIREERERVREEKDEEEHVVSDGEKIGRMNGQRVDR